LSDFISQYTAKQQRLDKYLILLKDATSPTEIYLLEEWIKNIREWLDLNKDKYDTALTIREMRNTLLKDSQ
jgi:hypothetical protein